MPQLRALGPGFDPAIVAAIDARLCAAATEHHATLLLAVESGSRAWGSPAVAALIDAEFELARRQRLDEPWRPEPAAVAAANALFRCWILKGPH